MVTQLAASVSTGGSFTRIWLERWRFLRLPWSARLGAVRRSMSHVIHMEDTPKEDKEDKEKPPGLDLLTPFE